MQLLREWFGDSSVHYIPPSNSTLKNILEIYSKELKIGVQINTCIWMFIAALFLIAKRWKPSKCPSRGWKNKQNVVYPDNGIVFSHSKEWSSDTCYNMDEPWKHCSQWKKPDTKGCCTIIFHKCSLDSIWSHGENSHFPFVGSLLSIHPNYFPLGLWHSWVMYKHSQLPEAPRYLTGVTSSSLDLHNSSKFPLPRKSIKQSSIPPCLPHLSCLLRFWPLAALSPANPVRSCKEAFSHLEL